MLFLLNFFEEASQEPQTFFEKYGMFIVMGILIVGIIVFNTLSNKKAKKRNEEKNNQLVVGTQVTTIGGIVGTIVKLDDQFLWIETGVAPNAMTMQIVRQAIHSIGTPQNATTQSATQSAEESVDDEIK